MVQLSNLFTVELTFKPVLLSFWSQVRKPDCQRGLVLTTVRVNKTDTQQVFGTLGIILKDTLCLITLFIIYISGDIPLFVTGYTYNGCTQHINADLANDNQHKSFRPLKSMLTLLSAMLMTINTNHSVHLKGEQHSSTVPIRP